MAGDVPKETEKPAPVVEEPSRAAPPLERKTSPPGAFPETPADEPESFSVSPIPPSSGASNPVSTPAGDKLPDHKEITGNTVDSNVTTSKKDYEKDASSTFPEEKSFGVNPIPASSGAGNPVSTPAAEKSPDHEEISGNTVDSNVTTSKEDYEKDASSDLPAEKAYGVKPIPASFGTGNPISLPAGEKLPDHEGLTGNTIDSNVTTSKEDYEKDASSALPEEQSFGVGPIPASAGIGNPVSVAAGESVEQYKGLLPSSLQSNATTSKEDYEKAGSAAMPIKAAGVDAPELKDSAFSVPEKSRDMIPESSLPMSGDATDTIDAGPFLQSSGPGTTTAALAGQVPLEPKSKASVVDDEMPSDPSPVMQSSGPATTTAALAGQVPLEPKSKATVMDDETPSDATPFMQSSGPGATTAALAGQVPLEPRSKAVVIEDETPSATVTGPAPDVPEVVKESLSQAHESPEAAASREAVLEKREVENELLKEVKSTDAFGEPAPTIAAATSATAPATTAPDSKASEPTKDVEHEGEPSRDIGPMGRDPDSTAPAPPSPMVTSGVGESATSAVNTPQKPSTAPSSAASSPAATNNTKDKKKKRMSFFGKLKDKLKG